MSIEAEVYCLKVISAEGLPPAPQSLKPPKAYVKVAFENHKWQTETVHRSLRPSWDKVFQLVVRNRSSVVSFKVVHCFSLGFMKISSFQGGTSIEIRKLLEMSENSIDVILDLHPLAKGNTPNRIKVRCSAPVGHAANIEEASRAMIGIETGTSAPSIAQAAGDATMWFPPRQDSYKYLVVVLGKLDVFKRVVDEAVKIHPYARFAWEIVSSVYNVVKGQVTRDKAVLDLVAIMASIYSFVDAIEAVPDKVQILEETIKRIFIQTVECAIFIQEYACKGFGGRVLRDTFLLDTSVKIKSLTQGLQDLYSAFCTGVSIHTSIVSFRIHERVSILFKNHMLEDLEPVRMDASDRTTCLPTTRHDVLSFIINWATRPSGDTANILWVHGLAGAGKSTIATTVANYFHDLGRLGAFLFFDRGFPEKSHPSKVIRTLAHQLGSYDSRIGMALSEIINKDRMIPLCALSSQFTKLIINPLSSLEVLHSQGPILIVLDALDECGSPDERQKLLKVLAEQVKDLPSNLRFLITSRAERDIHCAFQSVPHILHLELRLTSTEGNQDILAYFRYRMTAIRMKNEHLGLPADWPGRENILELTTRAYGLFIWASTPSDFIDAHNPDKRLKLLLQGDLSSGSQRALDILYKTALECAGDWDDEDFVADFRSTVGIILVARIPLSNSAIDELLRGLGVQPSIGIVLRLGCIFQLHPVVRVLHPSFFDFVSTRSRCDRNTWVFEPGPYHGVLGKQCLDWLEGELKENMCDLTLSANLTDEHLSEHVSYACTFWIDHICLMNECNRSIIDQVYGFLRRHLLHWFEAMSILKQSRGIREMLGRLLDWIMATYPDHKYLTAFTREALEFATTFMFTIEAHPLLVYMTALPFAQDMPTLYSHFHDSSVYPKVVGQTGPLDFRIPEVFAGHHDLVWSMAYSPDKTRLASGSMDSTIRIWDTSTGLEIFSALEGHENTVLSVVFSPDGTMIASCSVDKTVRVWDAASGSELFSSLRGHQQAVVSLSFSANCTRIVSGSYDKTVRIWDMKISDPVCAPLTLVGHEGCVTSVSFSPDDTKIVSCSHDRTIRVWNAISGSQVFLQSPLRVDDMPTSVAFSANGRRIISMSQTNATSWDATSGCRLLTSTETDFLPLHSVAVVAGSQYTPYWIEDLETGRTISNLPFRVRASCSLSYENTLAVGTTDGSVFFMQFPPALWTCAETRAADQRRSDVQVPFTCGVIDQLFPYPYTGGKHHTYRHHIMETM